MPASMDTPEVGLDTPDPIREKLDPFFMANPESEYRREEDRCFIVRPWGDPTLELRIPDDSDVLAAALNSVHLPPHFTALWHLDLKQLEMIWSPVGPEIDERQRVFDFAFRGKTYHCAFRDASDRVLLIAEASRPVKPPSSTGHRNLAAFARYFHIKREHPTSTYLKTHVPTSFWIAGLDWDEDEVLDITRHLNFFMRYFDSKSPRVLIHTDQPPEIKRDVPVRYPYGAFPGQLSGRPLDSYLLGLWESAVNAEDPFRAFIYNYQVLEYAAFYYLHESTLQTIKRILARPDTCVHPDAAANLILEVISENRMEDEAKIVAVVKQVVDAAVLWKEIEPNHEFFSSETGFDGGFTLQPLLKAGWTLDDFRSAWVPKLPDAIRRLRNALVHSREARMAKVISPTRANYERLRPWGALLGVIAMHAILYE